MPRARRDPGNGRALRSPLAREPDDARHDPRGEDPPAAKRRRAGIDREGGCRDRGPPSVGRIRDAGRAWRQGCPAASRRGEDGFAERARAGAAPASPMPVSASRTGPHATTGSSSIFSRPRTTSGMRAVPAGSAVFEPPTADDIDKALSFLEEKGGPAPVLPTISPTVINRSDGEADQRRRPDARVRCERGGGVLPERRGHGQEPRCYPRPAFPTATEGDGELTQRRSVDPVSGDVTGDVLFDATGEADKERTGARGDAGCAARVAGRLGRGAAREARRAATEQTRCVASEQAGARKIRKSHSRRADADHDRPARRDRERPLPQRRPLQARSAARVCTGRSRF